MHKQLQASHVGQDVNVEYVSFQGDGSISFGLTDRTFIVPRHRERRFVWNAYNRITVQYVMPNNPNALLPVQNPHFTFHPDAMFHLKSNKDKKADDEAIFEGIADVGIVLDQQEEMPWIRTISACGQQAVDLALGSKVLALAIVGVLCPTTANCRLFRLRGSQLHDRIHWQIPPRRKSTVDIIARAHAQEQPALPADLMPEMTGFRFANVETYRPDSFCDDLDSDRAVKVFEAVLAHWRP
jgi:hypothetical protein